MTRNEKQRRLNKFPCRLLFAQEIVTPGAQKFSRENYPVLTVEYVTAGAGHLEINGKKYKIPRDCVYFLTPGSTHAYWPEKSDPWSKMYFVIYGEMVDFLLQSYHMNEVYFIPDCPELKKYFREMIYLKKSRDNSGKSSVIFHAFLDDASRLITKKKKSAVPEKIESLRKQLDSALGERFSLTEYAESCGCSESALIRSFRRYYKTTPHEYLMESKIQEAENYLLYTGLSVKEIAAALAFSDQYHFSNAFKNRKGCSPSDFRRQHASDEIS